MSEHKRTCDLSLCLYRKTAVKTRYDAKAGLTQTLRLFGYVNDPPFYHWGIDNSATHLHLKPVELAFFSPQPPEEPTDAWLQNQQLNHVCGSVWIAAGAKPEQFEIDGEAIELPPIRIDIALDANSFEAIRRQASDDHGRMMSATITMAGDQLPELGEDNLGPRAYLKDLDVSVARVYAVASFEMRSVEGLHHDVGLMNQAARDKFSGATSIQILLTETKYEYEAPFNEFRSISCVGRILDPEYSGADAYIRFESWEPPVPMGNIGFNGEFVYYGDQFCCDLKYIPEQARNALVPLLAQDTETAIVLTVDLDCGEQELTTANKLKGHVIRYRFNIERDTIGKRASNRLAALETRIAVLDQAMTEHTGEKSVEQRLLELIESKNISSDTRERMHEHLHDYRNGKLDEDESRYIKALYDRLIRAR